MKTHQQHDSTINPLSYTKHPFSTQTFSQCCWEQTPTLLEWHHKALTLTCLLMNGLCISFLKLEYMQETSIPRKHSPQYNSFLTLVKTWRLRYQQCTSTSDVWSQNTHPAPTQSDITVIKLTLLQLRPQILIHPDFPSDLIFYRHLF